MSTRSWMYTINNPSETEKTALEGLDALCHVCGNEVGASGTPHLQGYIRFKQPQRLSWWKNQFPRAHVEPRKGTEAQAIAYCRKDNLMLIDKVPTEDESRPRKMGRFEYAEHICDLIEQGRTTYEIYKAHRGFYFYNRRAILQVKEDVARWKINPEHEPDA